VTEPAQGTALGQKIIFNIEKSGVDNARLMTVGQQALVKRGWKKESCSANCLRGSIVKDGVKHWVEMRFQSPYVEVGFIAGTPEGKTGWLANLQKDTLTLLDRS
jgi:hypothetical protein